MKITQKNLQTDQVTNIVIFMDKLWLILAVGLILS